MDSAILQLFGMDEIMDRLGRNRLTGSLHVFTPKDSANIFFRDGLIIAVVHGLFEGEDVLRKILDWKECQFVWQTHAALSTPAQKPMKLNISEFLLKVRPAISAPIPVGNASSHFSITSTAPVRLEENGDPSRTPRQAIPSTKAFSQPGDANSVSMNADMTATKTILPTENDRQDRDEALLKKYKLVLVSVDSPAQKLKISRVSSLIGRNPACDIAIVHPSISRQHCLLQMTDRGLHVKDLDTTNGTKVNGIMMKEGYINAGDKLTVGHLVFVLEKE